ncbi:polyadenylate-binding protein 3-like [Typha angustifolia]|uniref:polyadenylate-binding protein 3-like n=1 Tax=Typha angustifolia TaxID=59011 RepID=UPI003C2BC1B6
MMSPAPPLQAAVFSKASLYVGDLDRWVWEEQLFWLFNRIASVASVRVCRDQIRGTSLGYAYVNFHTVQDASFAKEMLNFTPVNGKPIRIMWSNRDPSFRKSGRANVFIKNLESRIDSKSLHDTFACFGTILSCKVASDINGKSKGYGFVQFEKEESASTAIDRLNGMLLNGKKVYVGLFIRRQERNKANKPLEFTNVYIKNLPETFTNDDLQRAFRSFGDITSAVVAKDKYGKSRCFGFVNFEKTDAAAAAVENLNGRILYDKVVFVGRAQKKAERQAELKAKYENERKERLKNLEGLELLKILMKHDA